MGIAGGLWRAETSVTPSVSFSIPARRRAFCPDVKEFMDTLSTALEFAERGMGKGSRTPR
jgi:hypothetical protein